MKAVLDENVPRPLAFALRALGLHVDPFPSSWRGLSNGKLLGAIEGSDYAVLMTGDRNMSRQQKLEGRSFGVLALPGNELREVLAMTEQIARQLAWVKRGRYAMLRR